MMRNNDIKIIRFSELNDNVEALTGKWGQVGNKNYSLTIIKNILFINLYKGCIVGISLPECYDCFISTSKGRVIEINDSKLTASLDDNETASGFVVLKAWN